MFFLIAITFIAITVLLLIFHIFRKLCQEPMPPPAYRNPQGPPSPAPPYGDPRGPAPPPLTLMPALPSLPSGAVPVGLEPPPYSEVTAKPFLYPLPQGPCPECGHNPTAQPPSPPGPRGDPLQGHLLTTLPFTQRDTDPSGPPGWPRPLSPRPIENPPIYHI